MLRCSPLFLICEVRPTTSQSIHPNLRNTLDQLKGMEISMRKKDLRYFYVVQNTNVKFCGKIQVDRCRYVCRSGCQCSDVIVVALLVVPDPVHNRCPCLAVVVQILHRGLQRRLECLTVVTEQPHHRSPN